MALHEVGLEPKSGLAGAGAADDKHILVPRRLGVFGAAGHHQAFRLGQDHVVLENRVDIRPDVLRCAP